MNLWTAFQKVLASGGPTQIGEVVSVESTFGDQRCTVRLLPGEALVQATGTGRLLEVGQRWVIRDGNIIEEGPRGTMVNVDL